MKILNIFAVLLLLAVFFASGCDSSTDTVAVSNNPPVLVSPADRDSTQGVTPTFTWTGTADKFQIGTNNTFSTVVHSAAVSGTSYTMPSGVLQPNTWYYWHAGKTSGSNTTWSTYTYSFRTNP